MSSSGYREIPALGDWVLDQGSPIGGDATVGFRILLDVLDEMSDEDRSLLEAVYWERLTYAELASRRSLTSKQAAHLQVKRALADLEERLRRRGYAPREELT